ncbi:MAG: hypothetical protein V7731_12070 [Amphritea sp.]
MVDNNRRVLVCMPREAFWVELANRTKLYNTSNVEYLTVQDRQSLFESHRQRLWFTEM